MSTLIPSLLTLLGVVVGALLQFFISRRIAREGKYLDKRVESYADYMAAIGKSGRPGVPDEEAELMVARAKLLAYGHDRVVQALSTFDRLGGYVKSEEQKKAFVSVIREIRRDVGGNSLTDEDLFRIVMHTEWKDW
jgi:hypothetical protein